MSNLYKGSRIVNTSSVEHRIIDSNERILSRLDAIRNEEVPVNDNMAVLRQDKPNEEVDEDNDKLEFDDLTTEEDILNNAHNKAIDLINEAQLKAQKLVKDARDEAVAIKEEAKHDGYLEGENKAKEEYKKKEEALIKEYEDKKNYLEEDYAKMRAELEPMLMETLLTIYTKITHTMADANKDTILHLVNSVMRNTEISRHFLIRVSKEDYQFMVNSKEKLYEHVSRNVNIEIYQDSNLKRNQCVIETDAGVFDCSLDIQLENLEKELRILSCLVE